MPKKENNNANFTYEEYLESLKNDVNTGENDISDPENAKNTIAHAIIAAKFLDENKGAEIADENEIKAQAEELKKSKAFQDAVRELDTEKVRKAVNEPGELFNALFKAPKKEKKARTEPEKKTQPQSGRKPEPEYNGQWLIERMQEKVNSGSALLPDDERKEFLSSLSSVILLKKYAEDFGKEATYSESAIKNEAEALQKDPDFIKETKDMTNEEIKNAVLSPGYMLRRVFPLTPEQIAKADEEAAFDTARNDRLYTALGAELRDGNLGTKRWNGGESDSYRDLMTSIRELRGQVSPDSNFILSGEQKKAKLYEVKTAAENYIREKLKDGGKSAKDPDWTPSTEAGKNRFYSALKVVELVNNELDAIGEPMFGRKNVFSQQCMIRKAFNPKERASTEQKLDVLKANSRGIVSNMFENPVDDVMDRMLPKAGSEALLKDAARNALSKNGGDMFSRYAANAERMREEIKQHQKTAAEKAVVKKTGPKELTK